MGPVIEGILVVEVDVDRVDGTDGVVYITDHTLLWREKGKGAPNVLESAVGRWVHAGMVRWMVEKGVEGVVEQWKGGKGM